MYMYMCMYIYVYIYIYASLDCFRITSCNPAAPSRCPTTEPHNAWQHIEGPMSKHECSHAHVVAFLYTHLHTRVQAHALHAHSMRMQRAIPHPQWSLPTGGNEVPSLCVLCNLRVVVYARVCSPPILCMTRHAHACLRAAHVSSHVHDNVNVGDNVSYVCMCVCVCVCPCALLDIGACSGMPLKASLTRIRFLLMNPYWLESFVVQNARVSAHASVSARQNAETCCPDSSPLYG